MAHFALVLSGLLATAAAGATGPDPSGVLKQYHAEREVAGRGVDAELKLALWCEAHGLDAEKARHLTRAVLLDPSNARARGLLGLVAHGGKWDTPEAVAGKLGEDKALARSLAGYDARRDALDATARSAYEAADRLTPVGHAPPPAARAARRAADRRLAPEHVKLALWCSQNGLKAEAAAHLTQAVVLDPHLDVAWRRLGYVKADGRWVTQDQLSASRRDGQAVKQAGRYWQPLLKTWRKMLADPSTRGEAEAELSTVNDPHALPALLGVFGTGAESDQAVAVRVLGKLDSEAASRELAMFSMQGATDAVRSGAVAALRDREPRDYAPMLVGLIRSPIKTRVQPVGGPGSPGALLLETPRFKVLRTYDAPPIFQPTAAFYGYVGVGPNGLPVVIQGKQLRGLLFQSPEMQQAALANAEGQTAPLAAQANFKAATSQQRLVEDVREIEAANAEVAGLNAKVADVLQAALGAPDLKDDENAWNVWWNDKLGYKYEPPPQVVVEQNASPQPEPPYVTSCFAAGTPVRTAGGRRPVESVRVGDRVLAQDASTGALGFKPVVAVYHNPPAETVSVRLDRGETVVASVYHRFWRAGLGWAQARELKAGDVLRVLGGTARVVSAETGPTVPVYNLDVADAHTFLVGKSDALVHDNTLPDRRRPRFDAADDLAGPKTPRRD